VLAPKQFCDSPSYLVEQLVISEAFLRKPEVCWTPEISIKALSNGCSSFQHYTGIQ